MKRILQVKPCNRSTIYKWTSWNKLHGLPEKKRLEFYLQQKEKEFCNLIEKQLDLLEREIESFNLKNDFFIAYNFKLTVEKCNIENFM